MSATLPLPQGDLSADPPQPGLCAGPVTVPGYEIVGELGRGGMGVVYKARQVGLNRTVALKMILSGPHAGKEDLARFRIEAEAVARLQHPGIVQIYQVGMHNGLAFLSLEYCPGGSLAERLQGAPLLPRVAAQLVEILARAMHVAHQEGIVHRDLKPANVLLTGMRSSTRGANDTSSTEADDLAAGVPPFGMPKITDFGLAKVHNPSTAPTGVLDKGGQGLTATGAVMGTPGYMAPEQASGRIHDIGPATDIYGLGAILYELVTGRPPFVAATQVDTVLQVLNQDPVPPRMLNRLVDPDLEKIILKCLEKRADLRYACAGDLADDLRRYREGDPVSARSVNLLERLHRELAYSQHESELRPWGLGLILLGALIFLTHLATSLLLLTHANQLISYWIPRTVLLALLVPLVLRYRPQASIWPTNAVERLIWAVWVGYLLTFLSLFWVMRLLNHRHLEIYGVVTAVSGLAWFIMGGHVWGGCYLIGGAFLVLAPVMALLTGSPWSPFCFGLLWSAALLILGLHYRRLGRDSR